MNRSFLLKTVRDSCWLLVACAGTLFAFSWIRVFIVASMEAERFQKIARNLPDILKRLSPVPIDELVSYPGLIGFTFEEPITYLIMAVWTISRCSDCVSGEIGRGTMEMLMAQPVSRRKYLLGHSLITVLGIVILAGVTFEGTRVGITNAEVDAGPNLLQWRVPLFGFDVPLGQRRQEPRMVPMTEFVNPAIYRSAAVNYFCFGFFLAGLTTAASSVDRFRWRTIGLIVSFYVMQTIIELTGLAVDGFQWLLNFTFFAAYEPVAFSAKIAKDASFEWQFFDRQSSGAIPDLGPLGCDASLILLGSIGFAFAFWAFGRRDLPAPL